MTQGGYQSCKETLQPCENATCDERGTTKRLVENRICSKMRQSAGGRAVLRLWDQI